MESLHSVVVYAVAGAGGSSAVVDTYARRVPNALTVGIASLGLVLATTDATRVGVAGALGGLAAGLLLMLPGFLVGATGGGDVKLFAALGTLLGPRGIGVAFIYTALAGAAFAAVIARRRKRLATTVDRAATLVLTPGAAAEEIERASENNRFAYAPAIALGALAAALGF